MAKSESTTLLETDQLGIVLTAIVLVFSTLQFFNIPLVSALFVLVFAVTSLLASMIYFVRVRDMTDSSQTPVSDTLVVLGGIYLALSLVLDEFAAQSLSIIWSLVLIGGGIIGRLFLLDSGIRVLLDSIISIISNVFDWTRVSPANILRGISLLVAIGLYIIPLSDADPYQPGISILLLSLFVIIGFFQKEELGSTLRQFVLFFGGIGLLASGFYTVFTGYSLTKISIVTLSSSLLLWGLGYSAVVGFLSGIYTLFVSLASGLISITKFVYHQFTQNPIRSLRILSIVIGAGILMVAFVTLEGRFILISAGFFILSVIDILIKNIPYFVQALWDGVKWFSVGLYNFIKSLFIGLYSLIRSIVESIGNFFVSIYNSFKEDPIRSTRLLALFLVPFAFFFLPDENNLNLYIAGILLAIAVLPAIVPALYNFFKNLFIGVYQAFQNNFILASQYTLVILAAVTYVLIPDGDIAGGYNQRTAIPIILLLIAFSPTLVSWIQAILPGLKEFAINLVNFILPKVTNISNYFWLAAIFSIYQLFVIPSTQIITRLIYAILAGISLSVVGKYYFLRFVDSLQLAFIRIANSFGWITSFLFSIASRKFIQSALAWVILLSGLFGWFLPIEYRGIFAVRAGLVLLSIVVWNTADSNRTKKFINNIQGFFSSIWYIINAIFGGIYTFFRDLIVGIANGIVNLLRWALRNIFILALFLLGIGFFIISFGLFIPGTVGFVVTIFGNVLENRLVSIIIGGFFGTLGVITIQQAFARRDDLQVKGGN